MRICFVLPEVMYDVVTRIVKNDFPSFAVDYLVYRDYKEAPSLLGAKQKHYDAVIFAGQAPYECSLKRLRQETYWCYFSRAGSSLRKALLEAALKGWDIKRLSFDSYEEVFLREVYREVGVPAKDIQVRTFTGDRTDEDYNQKAFDFHFDNMRNSRVDGCATTLSLVSKWMKEAGIQHVEVWPCFDVVRDVLSETLRFYRVKRDAKSQIVVLMLHIDYPSNFPSSLESEYHFMLEKTRIAQQIYQYAERIQASVSESSMHDYTLFSTKEIIEADTRGYRSLLLLDWLEKVTVYLVSVGVGQGETVAQARQNALNAVLKARKYTRCAAYAQLSDGQYVGPMFGGESENLLQKEASTEPDAQIEAASKDTGLSVNTIYRLRAFLLDRQNGLCTSEELSSGLHISKRSADRLIERLENSGYAKVDGKTSPRGHGRPSRIIRVKLM
jgi:hypothetical protein